MAMAAARNNQAILAVLQRLAERDSTTDNPRSKVWDTLSQYELFKETTGCMPHCLLSMAIVAASLREAEVCQMFIQEHTKWVDVYSDPVFRVKLLNLGIAQAHAVDDLNKRGRVQLIIKDETSHFMVMKTKLPVVLAHLSFPWARLEGFDLNEAHTMMKMSKATLQGRFPHAQYQLLGRLILIFDKSGGSTANVEHLRMCFESARDSMVRRAEVINCAMTKIDTTETLEEKETWDGIRRQIINS